jgi:hypothetical protein
MAFGLICINVINQSDAGFVWLKLHSQFTTVKRKKSSASGMQQVFVGAVMSQESTR